MMPPAKKGPSLIVQGGLFLATTVMAVGIGFVGGGYLRPGAPAGTAEAPAAEHGAAKAEAEHGGEKSGEAEAPPVVPGRPAVVTLAPITVNLAAPAETWLRVELAVEFTDAVDAGLADSIQEDAMSYLRTLKLHQIQGPSGLIHLKADLNERARIRSEGKAAQLFVRAILFE